MKSMNFPLKAQGKTVITANGRVIANCNSRAWAENFAVACNAYVTTYRIGETKPEELAEAMLALPSAVISALKPGSSKKEPTEEYKKRVGQFLADKLKPYFEPKPQPHDTPQSPTG